MPLNLTADCDKGVKFILKILILSAILGAIEGMTISKKVNGFMEKSSWIRKMFEEGIRLKKEFGEENVFDLSLGNPVIEPPKEVQNAMVNAARDNSPGMHRYMPNAGFQDVREAIATTLSEECQEKLSADDLVMVCGAAGGLNITLKTLLDSDDAVKKTLDIAHKYDIWVFSDECYEQLTYDTDFTSIKNFDPKNDKIITFQSCSKTYAMTGWRIGYTAGEKKLIKAMSKLQGQSTSCPIP